MGQEIIITPENSHVVPALIRRFHEAKQNNHDEVVVWGSGTPKREFLYVDDMAEASLLVHNIDYKKLSRNTSPMLSHINIGTGADVTIRELADIIQAVIVFKGRIRFDSNKPDGAPRKLMDVSKIKSLGWKQKTNLSDGIYFAYKDFVEHIQ